MKQKEKIKLLTVEDAFLVEGRGLMVLPMIPESEYSGPMSFSVVIRKPNGENSTAEAHLDIPRLHSPPKHYSFVCSLAGVNKQDIPIGTEIWFQYEPAT